MLLINRLITMNKGAVRVASHARDGHRVKAHTRVMKTGKKAISRKDVQHVAELADKHEAYLIFMAKEIAKQSGIHESYSAGNPSGDFADIVADGRVGMIMGGLESLKAGKKAKVDMLTQMKTRAKERMRLVANKLSSVVTIPKEVIMQLSVVAKAREKYAQANDGLEPNAEELAAMITLHKRTATGKVEVKGKEKLARVKELIDLQSIRDRADYDEESHVAIDKESDPTYWTRWTSEQRAVRQKVHNIMDRLIAQKKLTKEEQSILYLRFYIDDPDKSTGMNVRSFEAIGKVLDKVNGLKNVETRKAKGDTFRFQPEKKVPDGKGGFKTEKYARPINAEITSVDKNSFKVKRGAKTWNIKGKPPIKSMATKKSEVWTKYLGAMSKILAHPEASDELRTALAMIEKSIKLVLPKKMFIT